MHVTPVTAHKISTQGSVTNTTAMWLSHLQPVKVIYAYKIKPLYEVITHPSLSPCIRKPGHTACTDQQ